MDARLISFLAIAITFSLLEFLIPRRKNNQKRLFRWGNNYALIFVGNLISKVILPMGTVAFAIKMEDGDFGLLNWLQTPSPISVIFTIIFLDFIIYWQHVIFHRVPILWRLHRVHHSDDFLDVSSALRFHPIEILLSYGIKFFFIFLLGASSSGVLIFEIILNGCAIFNHSNIYLPRAVDQTLRKFLVTPDFHRIHHSVVREETDSNFGFNISLWDYLFKTYRTRGFEEDENYEIGVPTIRNEKKHWLHKLLWQPFVKVD